MLLCPSNIYCTSFYGILYFADYSVDEWKYKNLLTMSSNVAEAFVKDKIVPDAVNAAPQKELKVRNAI